MWIKGHQGHCANERPNELVKSELLSNVIDTYCKNSIFQIRNEDESRIKEEWLHRWDNAQKVSRTKNISDKVDFNRIKGDFFIGQIFTGHGIFRAQQATLFGKNSKCQWEKTVGTAEHLIRGWGN
ncbi:hypothetical protein AVEN_262758-1 [Araneus ventricosus]|uniref:RNase H type-1 domain-containing protein n=1 Tax=Araneus ventricosus TaxID=182803 RepID=A0A4Y2PQP3_ARAVE|nr:hypothetical protein AVEN_262758-1 [Araneus ventricosus]